MDDDSGAITKQGPAIGSAESGNAVLTLSSEKEVPRVIDSSRRRAENMTRIAARECCRRVKVRCAIGDDDVDDNDDDDNGDGDNNGDDDDCAMKLNDKKHVYCVSRMFYYFLQNGLKTIFSVIRLFFEEE